MQLMIVGLYRAPCDADKSLLPFVYTCPKPDSLLRKDDRVFVYCNPLTLNTAYQQCIGLPIISAPDGTYGLADTTQQHSKSRGASMISMVSGMSQHFGGSFAVLSAHPSSGHVGQDGANPSSPTSRLAASFAFGSRPTSVSALLGSSSSQGSHDPPPAHITPNPVPLVPMGPVNLLSSSSKIEEVVPLGGSWRDAGMAVPPVGTPKTSQRLKMAAMQSTAVGAFRAGASGKGQVKTPGSSPAAKSRKKIQQ